ncbi:RICIN domain-containing protein, partial [Candidatus Uhrbacteria bacterium]|nr:RICIN domain-containing protein [Candidatus Uhrbacteria bacterium]
MRTAKILLHTFVGISMVFYTLATALLAVPSTAQAAYGYPSTIGFQGRLKNSSGQAISSGTYDFRFKLYDGSDASTATQTSADWIYSNDVTVTSGYFSTSFTPGSDTSDFADDLYVLVAVASSTGAGASADGSYESFSTTTLIQLNKTPYAIFAQAIETNTTAPSSNLFEGRVYYNPDDNAMYVYTGSAFTEVSSTLDDAYDAFGSAAQIITVDDAVTGISFDVAAAGNYDIDLQSTGDFRIQDAGSTWAQFTDAQSFDVDGTGAISLDSDAASNFNTSAGDLTLQAEAASVNVLAAEAAADAIRLNASNAAGGIDIDAGTAGIAIDSTGALSLDAAGTSSNFSLASDGAGDDLTLAVTGATDSSVVVNSSGTGTDAVDVNATAGGITLDAAGGISIDAAAASNLTTSVGALTLSTTAGGTSSSVILQSVDTSSDAIYLDADGAAGSGIYLDAYDATNNVTGVVTLDGSSLSLNSFSSGGITLSVGDSGNFVASTANGDLSLTAQGATQHVNITATNGDVNLITQTAGGSINIGTSGDVTRTVNIATTLGSEAINIGTVSAGSSATDTISIGNDDNATSITMTTGTGGLDVNLLGEFQIDGALTDIGTGTYTVANGDNDLGVEGDFEVNGTTTLEALTITDLTVTSGARIGTGSTPDAFTALADDSFFVEGLIEVDGAARLDGGVSADGGVFTVADTSGNLHTSGTLDADGAANIADTTAGADVTMGNSTGNLTFLSDNADFTLTDATDNVFQLVNSANSRLYIDVDAGATDTLTLGNSTDVTALNGAAA